MLLRAVVSHPISASCCCTAAAFRLPTKFAPAVAGMAFNNNNNHTFAAAVGHRQFSVSSQLRDMYFTQRHEWIELDEPKRGAIGTVGITDYAQKSLGDVVYVELPELNALLTADNTCGAIESVKAASDLYAPVSGEVTERNEELHANPHLVNKSCYEKGWLYKLKIVDPSELSKLMSEKQYQEFETTEANKGDETQNF